MIPEIPQPKKSRKGIGGPKPRPPGPLTWAEAREQVHYDQDTGILTWVARKPRIQPGYRAGGEHTSKKGYRFITICGKEYAEHNFIWFWMKGEWPPNGYTVDHKNLVESDNRWDNLRLATNQEQQRNTNRYGPTRGVTMRVSDRTGVVKWRALIGNGRRCKRIHLGYFNTQEEAIAVYRAKAREMYGEFYCDDI